MLKINRTGRQRKAGSRGAAVECGHSEVGAGGGRLVQEVDEKMQEKEWMCLQSARAPS